MPLALLASAKQIGGLRPQTKERRFALRTPTRKPHSVLCAKEAIFSTQKAEHASRSLAVGTSGRVLCGQTRGAVVKIFLLGATGNAGRRILRLALQRAHEVTAFVRDETKLLGLVDRPS